MNYEYLYNKYKSKYLESYFQLNNKLQLGGHKKKLNNPKYTEHLSEPWF